MAKNAKKRTFTNMKKWGQKIWKFCWKAALWFFILSIASVILFRFVPVPITPLMVIRCVQQKMDGKEMRLKKDWESRNEISDHLELAVMCSEDQNFIKHFGFDFTAIEKAVEHNEHSKRKRGASTITQQVAKNVFLWPGRSWIRKGFEVYFTFLIEVFWSKKRIMEVYLNVAEMGDGIYGGEAAAQYHFKKHAKGLSKYEASLIAATLPNPRKMNAGKPSAFVQKRSAWILQQMGFWGGKMVYEEKK